MLHSRLQGIRTYPNPQQSLMDAVVFNKNVDYSHESMFGKSFHKGAAGKLITATQPPPPTTRPITPRIQYGGGKPSNNDSAMHSDGAPPAGLRTVRRPAARIHA